MPASSKVIFLIFLAASLRCVITVQGQQKKLSLNAGASYSTFQDTKYSDVQYSGFGGYIGTGFSRLSKKSLFKVGILYINSKESPNTHESTSSSTLYTRLEASYLKHITSTLYVGIKSSLIDLYLKTFENLTNNKNYYNISSHLYIHARYSPLDRLDIGLDLGILSYILENNSFGFSYFQQVLEEGKYQNQELNNIGFGILKYGTFFHLFSGFQMGINASWSLSRHFDVMYNWKVKHFSIVDNYPVTYGYNNLTISYNIINRQKN